jgi:hypothetical protein
MASVVLPTPTESLDAGAKTIVGAKGSKSNASLSDVKASEQSGSNTYVFAVATNVVIPRPNGGTEHVHFYAGQPVVLSAADAALLTRLGVTLPSPS